MNGWRRAEDGVRQASSREALPAVDFAAGESRSEARRHALAIDAYRSVARALVFVVVPGRFLDERLAKRIIREFSIVDLPLPRAPLLSDETLAELLTAIPTDIDFLGRAPESGVPADLPCLLRVIAARTDIPLSEVERLADRLVEPLIETLIERYGIARDLATYLAAAARQEALVRAMERAPKSRIDAYLRELKNRGLLTGDRILTYAGRGNSPLFFTGLGQCADLTGEMVEAFIEDGGEVVLERILQRTDFVSPLREAIVTAFREAVGTSQ